MGLDFSCPTCQYLRMIGLPVCGLRLQVKHKDCRTSSDLCVKATLIKKTDRYLGPVLCVFHSCSVGNPIGLGCAQACEGTDSFLISDIETDPNTKNIRLLQRLQGRQKGTFQHPAFGHQNQRQELFVGIPDRGTGTPVRASFASLIRQWLHSGNVRKDVFGERQDNGYAVSTTCRIPNCIVRTSAELTMGRKSALDTVDWKKLSP